MELKVTSYSPQFINDTLPLVYSPKDELWFLGIFLFLFSFSIFPSGLGPRFLKFFSIHPQAQTLPDIPPVTVEPLHVQYQTQQLHTNTFPPGYDHNQPLTPNTKDVHPHLTTDAPHSLPNLAVPELTKTDLDDKSNIISSATLDIKPVVDEKHVAAKQEKKEKKHKHHKHRHTSPPPS